jgi:hypothetical protein
MVETYNREIDNTPEPDRRSVIEKKYRIAVNKKVWAIKQGGKPVTITKLSPIKIWNANKEIEERPIRSIYLGKALRLLADHLIAYILAGEEHIFWEYCTVFDRNVIDVKVWKRLNKHVATDKDYGLLYQNKQQYIDGLYGRIDVALEEQKQIVDDAVAYLGVKATQKAIGLTPRQYRDKYVSDMTHVFREETKQYNQYDIKVLWAHINSIKNIRRMTQTECREHIVRVYEIMVGKGIVEGYSLSEMAEMLGVGAEAYAEIYGKYRPENI